jgi:hypothetical protein
MFDGEVNGDPIMGGPWLDQGGSARALLTIDIAHQLIAGHDTMAGSIGPEVLEQNIGGMSLTEALMTHQGMSALEAQTTLTQLEQFIAAPVTEAFQLIVENCPDSLGIRDRAEITLNTTIEHVLYLQEAGKLPPRPRLMSVGCGNGTTMLKAAQELRDTHGIHVQLEMFDQDPISLAFLKQTAENMGLTDAVNIHCLSIVKKTNRREIIDFSEHMGIQSDDEKPVVSENSGLIEYFKDDMNAKINQACMDALHPDAINISGNMLDKRPLKDYLRGMMGWPLRVIMRSIPQMVDIYEGMGIPREALDVRVTRDGVYAMYLTNMARLSAIKAEQEPVAHARTLRIVGLETTEVTA